MSSFRPFLCWCLISFLCNILLLNTHWVCKWRQCGSWNSSWCFDILQFSPQIICLAGIFYSKIFPFYYYSSVHALLFAGFPLEVKFQTPAGFAKNKLVQTFGFHLNVFYPRLSLGTGIFPETANIWGKWKLWGLLLLFPSFHGLG